MSKRQTAIKLMKENAGKPAIDVIELIAAANSDSVAKAKGLYKWIVAHDMAPGEAIASTRGRKAKDPSEKAVKPAKPAKAQKIVKPKLDKSIMKDKPKVTDKTVEEIADIRAKNLARLKAVGRKYAKGQYAEPKATGVENFDADEARAYVEAVTNDIESFKAPAFLSADEVKALV